MLIARNVCAICAPAHAHKLEEAVLGMYLSKDLTLQWQNFLLTNYKYYSNNFSNTAIKYIHLKTQKLYLKAHHYVIVSRYN